LSLGLAFRIDVSAGIRCLAMAVTPSAVTLLGFVTATVVVTALFC
jgi:hypothetical protein